MRLDGATPKALALRLWFSMAATTLVSDALAELSDQYAAFGNGPALFIMTPEEIEAWKAVKDDVDAKEFIDRFWARREPDYHVLFDPIVAYADRKFVSRRKKRGSLSDMGKVLIIMGPPTRERQYKGSERPLGGIPQNPELNTPEGRRVLGGTGPGLSDYEKVLCWVYEGRSVGRSTEICFHDRKRDGEWYLVKSEVELAPLFERANRSHLLPPAGPTPVPTRIRVEWNLKKSFPQ